MLADFDERLLTTLFDTKLTSTKFIENVGTPMIFRPKTELYQVDLST